MGKVPQVAERFWGLREPSLCPGLVSRRSSFAGPFVPFTTRSGYVKKAGMWTTASPCPSPSLRPKAVTPVRSPRTSIILAELARQHRYERRRRRCKRQQRRRAWARWVGRLAALRPAQLARLLAGAARLARQNWKVWSSGQAWRACMPGQA